MKLLTRNDTNVGAGSFDSVAWILEKLHLVDTGEYQSAALYGNEDSPDRVDFYTEAEPLVTSKPADVAVAWPSKEA